MIAEVYPVRRLPRSMQILDYQFPKTMHLRRGSLVTIPFRSHQIFGIVRSIKDKPFREIRIKSILQVVDPQCVSEKELTWFETSAHQIVQPVSTLLLAHIPLPVRKHKQQFHSANGQPSPVTIPASEAQTISRITNELTKRRKAFAQTPDLKRAAALIAGFTLVSSHKKIIIVCPHILDARFLCQALDSLEPFCVTSEESKGERYRIWKAFRTSTQAMLITTRTGMFYADQQTTTVFLVRSGHPDHVLHERNPRLDTRIVMTEFADQMSANLYFLDVLHRPEDVHAFGKEHILTYAISPKPIFIDAGRERHASPHPVLSTSCLTAIEEARSSNQQVLLIYNKKGYAHRLRCEECHLPCVCETCLHVLRITQSTLQCTTCHTINPIPVVCPACHGQRLTARGFGPERIAEALKTFFPTTDIQLIDTDHFHQPTSPIVIATRAYLENLFNPSKASLFGVVIHLDPDTALYSTDYRSSQRAMWAVFEWWGLAHAYRSSFIVQTNETEWFEQRIAHAEEKILEELELRKAYQQPPFSDWISVRLHEPEQTKHQQGLHHLKAQIEQLPSVRVNIVPHKNTNESELHIKSSSESLPLLLQLFSDLDDRYIIDMHAYIG